MSSRLPPGRYRRQTPGVGRGRRPDASSDSTEFLGAGGDIEQLRIAVQSLSEQLQSIEARLVTVETKLVHLYDVAVFPQRRTRPDVGNQLPMGM